MKVGYVKAYRFPNGFGNEASKTFTMLSQANLKPVWRFDSKGNQFIMIPKSFLPTLRAMQTHNPATWGNPN